MRKRASIGERATCRTCGQDIEFHGGRLWVDRGNGTHCLPYESRERNEVVRPRGTHKPLTDYPTCGHSACRGNWIETGETSCVEGKV
jgi:hypothetical protein